ncbi:MAG TPA: hypothetical protein VHK88_03190 [Aquihabitans sp.]|nr:hypothetical protein [Aquihabitans sp.]
MVEHWDRHLRPFVHVTLADDGTTDRVLAAAYVRAFRGLPRYRAVQTPGLWLHRVAYLATVDELRRRHRMSAAARAAAAPDVASPSTGALGDPTTDVPPVVAALRRLAPDQRALLAMVDLEGFPADVVAAAFDTDATLVGNRLTAARRIVARAGEVATGPRVPDLAAPPNPRADLAGILGGSLVDATGPGDGPSAALAPEAPPGTPAGRRHPPEEHAGDPADASPADRASAGADAAADPEADRLVEAARAVLATLEVPPAGPAFWADLGRRLLAERDRPAAPTPDPRARLARAHPAEPGFAPAAPPRSVASMADQADRNRPRRRWRRPLAIAAAVLVVAGVVAGAVVVGISGRTPDGSVSAEELGATLAAALDANRHLSADAVVELADVPDAGTTSEPEATSEPGATTEPGGTTASAATEEQRLRVTLGPDGSWAVTRTDAFDQTTYDGSDGLLRRVIVVEGPPGGPPTVLASEEGGLAAGPPDPAAVAPAPVDDLQAIGTLLRSDGTRRGEPTTVAGVRAHTVRRTVATGPGGAPEEWRVSVRRSDGLPIRIERRRDGRTVRLVRFSSWEPATEVPPETFRQTIPFGTATRTTARGFLAADLPAATLLGRGEAVTPAWLPEGFELAAVALRADAPPGERSTGGGTNPPDVAVASLGYQRGPERITVTTRATSAPEGDWSDPFVGSAADPFGAGVTPSQRTLGDGRFNRAEVRVVTDPVGRARLWGIVDDTVFTVSGDVTGAEAYRVAASLR